jgi:hypothetical protein
MRLELFPFRFRHPRIGKWMRVRYRAERPEIGRRYAEYEITGPAEVREVDVGARAFTPHAGFAPAAHRPIKDPPNQPPCPEKDPPDGDPPVKEPPEEDPANVDGLKRSLLLVFLRRYVTYCARRGRFAAMQGAARPFAAVRTAVGQTWQAQPKP